MDIPKFIGDNAIEIAALAAVVAAVATVAYAVLTYLLWADASTFRSTASVAVYPSPFDPTARYLSVVAENYGPAAALKFSLTYTLSGGHGEQIAVTKTYSEPVFGPNRTRRFMPRVDGAGKIETLAEMADRQVVVSIKWEWQDRGGVFGRTRKRHEEATYPLADYRKGLHGGEALADRQTFDILSALQDDLHNLAGEVESIRGIMEEPRNQRQLEALMAQHAKNLAAKAADQARPGPARGRKRQAPQA